MPDTPDPEGTPLRSTALELPMNRGMETIGPTVEQALEHLTPPDEAPQATGEPPSLDEPITEHSRCTGTRKNGTPCTVERGLRHGLCPTHSGAVDHAAAARARAQHVAARRDEARATVRVQVERSKLTPKAALALQLADRQEAALAQLLRAALDVVGADGQVERRGDDALLLRLWTEAYGKPGEALTPSTPEPAWEEVLAAWQAASAAGTPLRASVD